MGLALSANTPFGSSATTIGAGRLKLQASASGTDNNRIMISAVTNTIKIYDGNVLRVHIGDLSNTTSEGA